MDDKIMFLDLESTMKLMSLNWHIEFKINYHKSYNLFVFLLKLNNLLCLKKVKLKEFKIDQKYFS